GVKQLEENDIVLVDWDGKPRPSSQAGGPVRVIYYDPEVPDQRREHTFRLRGRLALKGPAGDLALKPDFPTAPTSPAWEPTGPAADPDLTPEFPGVTAQPSLQTWDPPPSLHYDNKRVTGREEDYWKAYRTTPKAYVRLATGQKLWGSRFGNVTSIRLAP